MMMILKSNNKDFWSQERVKPQIGVSKFRILRLDTDLIWR